MISESLRTVFFPVASRQYSESRRCLKLFRDVLRFTFIVSLFLFIPMSLLAPWFIDFWSQLVDMPPEKWAVTGHIIQVLAPFYILQLTNGPVQGMWIIAGRQNMDLVWQICFFVVITLGLLLGLLTGGYTGSIIGYGGAKVLAFSANIWFCWQFARGRWSHRPDTAVVKEA
jgi:O-antigen/teichoic acid export membrane protein